MPRKRIEVTPAVEAEIRARFERGETAETVAAAMSLGMSVPTLRRRQREMQGKAPMPAPKPGSGRFLASPPAAAAPETEASAEDVPDTAPDGTPIEQIDRWIARLEAAAAKAEVQGNLTALASLAAKVQSLMTLRHKSKPLAKIDHNDNPDLKALAAKGREKLENLLHELFSPSE